MQNPWRDLPLQPPFILPIDLPYLDQLRWKDDDPSRLRFEMYPVPYLGNPRSAEVYLLTLNPGFEEHRYREEVDNQAFVTEHLKSYTFESTPPFHVLDPRFSRTGGYIYYHSRMREVIQLVGWQTVAEKIMCLEFFPYHSQTYRHLPCVLPSQEYTFDLVRQAIVQKKMIIFQRSKKFWLQAIPELADYPTFELNSYRAPYLSRKNLGETAFEEMLHLMR